MQLTVETQTPGHALPWLLKLEGNPDRPDFADWVMSPMSASEHSSSLNQIFAEWPLWTKLDGRSGHGVRIRR